jgi:Putative manganese efflux pump
VQISVQADEPALSDRIAGTPSFERKIAAARLVKELAWPLTLNVVLHRHNIDRIGRILDLAEELGADRIELANTQYYTDTPEELHERMALFGIPLSLSLDNLLAGTGLGMLGFPPVFTAVVFGTITALMTFVGLQLGGIAARFIPIRSDLLSGMGLSIMVVVLVLGFYVSAEIGISARDQRRWYDAGRPAWPAPITTASYTCTVVQQRTGAGYAAPEPAGSAATALSG